MSEGGYSYKDEDDDDDDDDLGYVEAGAVRAKIIEAPSTDDLNTLDAEMVRLKSQALSPSSRSPGDKKYSRSSSKFYDDENLGDNFESTPWLPPSITKALDYRLRNIFRGGNANLSTVKVCRAPDLGSGMALYFQFVRSMGIAFLVMPFFSLPTLLFAYVGYGMPLEDRDGLSMYMFTLGNIGYDHNNPNYESLSACTTRNYTQIGANETCINVFDQYEFTLSEVGSIISLMEVLQAFVFFCAVYHLHRRVNNIGDELDKLITSVTDYSVMIRRLPPDTTPQELVSHFSALYPLDKPDWANRPPLAGTRPVSNTENTHDEMYHGTWVAECIVFPKIGKMLEAFLERQHYTIQLRRARAEMKMYAEGTPHSAGPNTKKYHRAERRLHKHAVAIEQLADKLITFKTKAATVNSTVAAVDETMSEKSGQSSNHNKDDRHALNAPAVSGFIIFEYSESMARCLEDHEKYNSFPYWFFRPEKLKFKGKFLDIVKAPEPDQIGWEYLEISTYLKQFYRILTGTIAIVILLICFAIIVQGSIYKTKFSDEIPNLALCDAEIPLDFAYAVNVTNYGKYSLVRAPLAYRTELDLQCEQTVANSFYAVMAVSEETFADTMVEYNMSVCRLTTFADDDSSDDDGGLLDDQGAGMDDDGSVILDDHIIPANTTVDDNLSNANSINSTNSTNIRKRTRRTLSSIYNYYNDYRRNRFSSTISATDSAGETNLDGLCPHPIGQRNNQFCPCISTINTQVCQSLGCYTTATNIKSSTGICESFEAKTIGACYCYKDLTAMIETEGISATLNYVRNSQKDVCYNFFENYATSTLLTYGTTLVTVVINAILKYILVKLTKLECHSQIDMKHASLMIKLFLSTYFNMALVVLIAFGYINYIPSSLQEAHIFQGNYRDFTAKWYGNVGSYLVLTFVIQVVTLPIYDLFIYAVLNPLKRLYLYPHIKAQSSHLVVMQDELNEMEVNYEFDVVLNTSQILALIFYVMTFAGGLPILIPLLAIVLLIYFNLHKRLLCRFYRRPAKIDDAIIRTVINFLPYAALIRLSFSCWILSNNSILPDTLPSFSISTPALVGGSSSISSEAYLAFLMGVKERLQAYKHVLPLAQQRLLQPNVFPLFLIFIFIILAKVFIRVWPYLPLHWFRVSMAVVYKAFCKKKKKVYVDDHGIAFVEVNGYDLLKEGHPYRQEMAPYTGDYFQYVCDKDDMHSTNLLCSRCSQLSCCACCGGPGGEPQLTDAEINAGWVHVDQGKYVVKNKQWRETTMIQGTTRIRGDYKRTYEVVLDGGCINSYSLVHNPTYRLAYLGLMEGATNVNDNKKKDSARIKSKRKAHIEINDAERDWASPSKDSPTSPTPKSPVGRQVKYLHGKASLSSSDEEEDDSDEDSDGDEDDDDDDESDEDDDSDDEDEDDDDDESDSVERK
jgi:hypothetical protein